MPTKYTRTQLIRMLADANASGRDVDAERYMTQLEELDNKEKN